MRSYVICSLVLVTVLLNCHPSLGLTRPTNFHGSIMGNGINDGKFDDIKNQIIISSGTLLQHRDVHLAHVFSWAAIDFCVDQYWGKSNQNQQELTSLVQAIYLIDSEAVTSQKWTKKRNIHSGDYIPDSNLMTNHSVYLGRDLTTINTANKTTALQTECISGGTIIRQNNCKILLHNAPANLRFGLGTANIVISDRLDLMGTRQGAATKKEKAIIEIYQKCFLKKTIETWCAIKNVTPYCLSGGRSAWAIRSSSSLGHFVTI